MSESLREDPYTCQAILLFLQMNSVEYIQRDEPILSDQIRDKFLGL